MIEHMRQEPPDDPTICENCDDSGEWRTRMRECSDDATMWCPAMGESIKIENCNAVEYARWAKRKGRYDERTTECWLR